MKRFLDVYSRLLVDNHISDIKPEYMSRFDPEFYAARIAESGVEAAMVYACDHNGNCYYPTQVGHRHANLHGRDLFGETVARLRDRGIVPSGYYTMIYHNDAWRRLPQARQRDVAGNTRSGRYCFVCPNHPDAVAFHQAQIREIAQYPIASLFLDMTFWPMICCCDSCRSRFRAETGLEIPAKIDWRDPAWVQFQRFRERSMAEFAAAMTAAAKEVRPDLLVIHQFSPVLHGWLLGQSAGIARASDYASGDFYGGKKQQRFGVKVLEAYSSRQPFEFMTSRCVTLRDHTSSKSEDEMFFHALTTLANGGAYLLIDAINPDGSLEPAFYRKLHTLQQRLRPFRECVAALHPQLRASVGVYFSMASCVDPSRNGLPVPDSREGNADNMAIRRNAVLDEAMGVARLLTEMHVPYRIVADRAPDLAGLKVLILANAAYLSAAEVETFRKFVQNGGTLIASGEASRYDLAGRTSGDFALADVFGVHLTGPDLGPAAYLETPAGAFFTPGRVPAVTAAPDTKIRGRVIVPDFPANDPERYASIHSNPPGRATEFAGWTEHAFGAGRCIYLAAPIPLTEQDSQDRFLKALYQPFLPEFLVAAENLPKSLEITVLESRETDEILLCLVNYQEELPPIPLHDLCLQFRMPQVASLTRASDGGSHPFTWDQGILTFSVPCLKEAEFFRIK